MKTRSRAHIPDALNNYLRDSNGSSATDLITFLERGGALMQPGTLSAVDNLLDEIRTKAQTIEGSERLRRRVQALILFFEEARRSGTAAAQSQKEVAFALLYFLKGYDRIPDSIPEIGLLDDAIVVETVLERHRAAFRTHWESRGRRWEENL